MAERKVIFLDIDGVLVTPKSPTFGKYVEHEGRKFLGGPCPYAMGILNDLAYSSGAEVVLSSTWRLYHPIGEMNSFLRAHGFLHHIIDYTPEKLTSKRGQEIDLWLQDNPGVEKFVILDDDSDTEPHMDHLVQTDFREGLTLDEYCKAMELLS